MLVSDREWTDSRDGTHWMICGFWVPPAFAIGPLTFRSTDSRHTVTCGAIYLRDWDGDLQRLLDGARTQRGLSAVETT